MGQTVYFVDAFASELFKGNPAAVCVVDEWPADSLMQAMAAEHNLAETAFVVPEGERFLIRWFTPELEVDLCGHATLASAHVLFHHLDYPGDRIIFYSPRSGKLEVGREGELLVLDFPADELKEVPAPEDALEAMGAVPLKAFMGKSDLMFIYESEEDVAALEPDMHRLGALEVRGLIATAPGKKVDFVSRFFAPQSGISEDPVTGSAHTSLTPYWSAVFGRKTLSARQISARGGELELEDRGERIRIGGRALTYMIGSIQSDIL